LKNIIIKAGVIIFFILPIKSYCQNYDNLVTGIKEDVTKIGEGYFEDFTESVLFSLSKSWSVNTRILPKNQFEFCIKTNIVVVNSSMKDFTFYNGNVIRAKNNDYFTNSTVIGNKKNNENIGVWIDGYEKTFTTATGQVIKEKINGFFLPNNLILPKFKSAIKDFIPIPYLQLNFGIGFNTDLSIRYNSSSITPGKIPFSLYGLAVREKLYDSEYYRDNQFYISILAGYNALMLHLNDINADKLKFRSQNQVYNLEIQFSKNFSNLGFKFDIGVSKTISRQQILGNLTLNDFKVKKEFTDIISKHYDVSIMDDKYIIKNPISISLEKKNIYGSFGTSYTLGLFTVNLSYSYGKYSSINTSIIISSKNSDL
jgi:hypothetical protein